MSIDTCVTFQFLFIVIADSISGANSVFAPESQENVTVCINRTFNFSCTRSVTFRAIDSALSINGKKLN